MVYPYNRILFSNAKTQAIAIFWKMSESRNDSTECKKPGKREYILFELIYVNIQTMHTWHLVTENRLVRPGHGVGEDWEGWERSDYEEA